MKAVKNTLGGNTVLNSISLVIFLVAMFVMVNSNFEVVKINYPQLVFGQMVPDIFWGVLLCMIGVATLIFSLSRSK